MKNKVLIVYFSIKSQLWIDRTCLVNLNISANICENIKHYENYTNQVQEEVSKLQIVGNFFHIVPEIIVGLLIGRY